MYDRLLLATDGSSDMDCVVEHAGELARTHGADVHALYVVHTGTPTAAPTDATLEGFHGLVHERGDDAIEAVEAQLPDDVSVEGSVTEGTPGTAILNAARDHDCDAIVMGTHGRAGLRRLLLGSVAERVVRRASIPVVVLPVEE